MRTMRSWQMNGRDYSGKLGPEEIIQLETTTGVGIFQIQSKVGMGVTRNALLYAAMKGNPKLDAQTFGKDFESEMERIGLPKMAAIALELIKDSGALGIDSEDEKKSGTETF